MNDSTTPARRPALQVKILDARIGRDYPLPHYATPGSSTNGAWPRFQHETMTWPW